MTHLKKILLAATGLIAASALATGASAQVTGQSDLATATTKASIIAPIKITKVNDLDFGTIIRPTGAATDTVTVSGSTRSTASNNAGLIGGTAATSASFAVVGEPSRAFTTVADATVAMTGPVGGALTITTVAAASNPTAIGTDGTAALAFGGTMPVGGTTVAGDYTGTLHVTVNYP